jgi:ActR/RegA family two-component response regulator
MQRVRDDKPDLVILDQWLEDEVLGHEVANALKETNPDQFVVLWSGGLNVDALLFLYRHCRADYIDRKCNNYELVIARATRTTAVKEPDWSAVESIEDIRREMALRMLARCGGNKSEAARRLNKDRTTFIRWLRERD